MKIAIFHNYIDNIGGAEYVDLTLAKALDADIYTTNINPEKIKKMGFTTKNITSIGKIPINAPLKQQFAYNKFKKLNLKDKYDFYFIGGDWAMSSAVHNKPNLWYVYSPIREIWDLHQYTRKNNVKPLGRPLFDMWVRYHRAMNRRNVKHVNNIVSISNNVRNRVRKYLERDSKVIYPPTDTSKYHYKTNGDYWLSVNRLISHKRIEMQMKAFAKLPDERLIVVGSYEQARHFRKYKDYIESIKPKNVTILHWVSSEKLTELYANCKGFITTSLEEDYGMAPVEAMASGKPVIAPNEGGYKETVLDNVTGKLIDNINPDKLADSIKNISKNPKEYKKECITHAGGFDTKVFIKKMKEEIYQNGAD
jgi:glycosyltransferase involved in cell wall biosynthesis